MIKLVLLNNLYNTLLQHSYCFRTELSVSSLGNSHDKDFFDYGTR